MPRPSGTASGSRRPSAGPRPSEAWPRPSIAASNECARASWSKKTANGNGLPSRFRSSPSSGKQSPGLLSDPPPSRGDPGSIQAVLAPTAAIQSRPAWAMNSGPLSDRMKAGTPRSINRSVRASITSAEFSLRFTRIVRHSRLSSLRIFSVRNAAPSLVRQWTKSSLAIAVGAYQVLQSEGRK